MNQKNSDRFITVLTTTFASEIAVIRGRIESEGIACFAQDELTVQVNPFYSNALGGVKLQVKESDLNRAIEILKEAGYIKDNDIQQPQESHRFKDYSAEQRAMNDILEISCPICGSSEVVISKKAGWLFLITSLLFLAPTPCTHKRYYCFECKREFRQKRRRNL